MSDETRPKRAVGLRYRHGEDEAPFVVSRGEGVVAEDILRIAREENIPVHRDAGLVEALLRLDYMQEIPEELFMLVAEIMVYAYEMMGRDLDSAAD